MPDPWRIAIVDSGLAGEHSCNLLAARRFEDSGSSIGVLPAVADCCGHGTAVAGVVCAALAGVELLVAQVFDSSARTTPATVAAAIRWAVGEEAMLIHLSLGLRDDRAVLARAVQSALASGCLIIASTPARGAMTFPAAYAGVIRATGDARCAPGEISVLNGRGAEFGGCPDSGARRGGASIGAAHVSQFVVSTMAPADSTTVRAALTVAASYRGAERRTVPNPETSA